MAANRFLGLLENCRTISITVKGRRTGRSYTRPVWFVVDDKSLWLLPVKGSQTQWYRNVKVNAAITVHVKTLRRRLRARPVSNSRTVRKVIRWFGQKYTPKVIRYLYSVFDAAVEVPLTRSRSRSRSAS